MVVCIIGCLGDRVSQLSTFQVDDHCQHVVVVRPAPKKIWFQECTSGGGGGVVERGTLGTRPSGGKSGVIRQGEGIDRRTDLGPVPREVSGKRNKPALASWPAGCRKREDKSHAYFVHTSLVSTGGCSSARR
jgi:hypothetical protein